MGQTAEVRSREQSSSMDSSEYETRSSESSSWQHISEEDDLVLYVLKLKHGKYYVGTTSDFEARKQQHFQGEGSAWTRLHEPLKVLSVEHGSRFDEDKRVKELMAIYGIDNVRGGTYSRVKLDDAEIEVLSREISHSANNCFRCSKPGHFAKDCPTLRKKRSRQAKTSYCTRCGRNSHSVKSCYAKTHINGHKIK